MTNNINQPNPEQYYQPNNNNAQQNYNIPGSPPGNPNFPGVPMGVNVDPQAPYGRDPRTGLPYSDKSKIVAGLLQLFLGGFGVGRFYLGYSGIGVGQLLTCGGLGVWSLVDAIMILMGNVPDPQGRPLQP